MEDLVSRDLIRYFGVSNFTVDQLALYGAAGGSLTVRSRLVAVQNQFDILYGEHPDFTGVLAHASRMGFAFVPYSPLALGLLTA